nr:CNNM domain-containing protein [Marinicella sp. W31]MDC2875684.1 CNNM domain-containing protein [Marinicella sp. W31]
MSDISHFFTEYWMTLAVIVGLIIISAFFSGSETALTAVSRARMYTLEQQGDKRAGFVNVMINRRDRLIGAL